MKKIIVILFCLGAVLLTSSKINTKTQPDTSSMLKKGCISGVTTIPLGSTTTLFTVANAQCADCYDWDVNNSGLTIVGSDQTNSVILRGDAVGTYTVCANRISESGCNSCCITVVVTGSGGGASCVLNERITHASCSPSIPGYNAQINASVVSTNPFPNKAKIEFLAHPTYHAGSQHETGGTYTVNAGAVFTCPTQFHINASISSSSGFYVVFLLKYTDLKTGQVCQKTLRALITGGCSSAPY